MLHTKVRARSLSPPLCPLHLSILLISANRLFVCRLRFNSPESVPPTLSWQARVCVKAVSQDWANGSRSAVSLACVEGICILKTELIPFLWSALLGSCPRSVLPVLSSPPPSLLEGISEQRGLWVRAGSTDLACRDLAAVSAHTQTLKVTLDKSCRLHLPGTRAGLRMRTPDPCRNLAPSPAPALVASPGQETCWGTLLDRNKYINTLAALPTSLFHLELPLLGIAGIESSVEIWAGFCSSDLQSLPKS